MAWKLMKDGEVWKWYDEADPDNPVNRAKKPRKKAAKAKNKAVTPENKAPEADTK